MSGTQLSWDDAEDEVALLAPTERMTNWRAFLAPLAANREVVVKDPEMVKLAADVVAVFAEHAALSGLTRAQLRELLGPSGRGWPEAVVESRLGLLIDMSFLEPYVLKAHQDRYVMRPAGLAGAIAAERLSLHGGVDELIGLLDRTRDLLRREDPDPDEALKALRTCRHGLMVFALDLQRQVATATPAELVLTQRRHDHTDFDGQVIQLNELVTRAFSGRMVLEDAAAALLEAAQIYRQELLAAVRKVLEQGGSSLNLDVLSSGEYLHLARTAGLNRLGHFGELLIADAPLPWWDGQAVVDTAASYTPARAEKGRPVPPTPRPGTPSDPFSALEDADVVERKRRRILMDDLIDDSEGADVTATLEERGWPGAARLLVDILDCHADPALPYWVDIAVPVRVDSTASVTYLHQVTVRQDLPTGEGENAG
ncbi:hypothetical protein ABT354_01275 [Streptomyces sp. NPDC000594]|uniref:hypothetical protein n=1 Tax=Streptomyces sp. NPDC000594 TaxID=3154261 RepID=UPI0033249667